MRFKKNILYIDTMNIFIIKIKTACTRKYTSILSIKNSEHGGAHL